MVWCGLRNGRTATSDCFSPVSPATLWMRVVSIASSRAIRGRMVDQPAREHGFARAGGTDHQQVVPAGGGHLQGALGMLLALDLAEIHRVARVGLEQLLRVDPGGSDLPGPGKELRGLGQRVDPDHLQPLDHRRLGGVLPRQEQPPDPQLAATGGHRQSSLDRLEAAIQAQLAQQQVLGQPVLGQLAAGGEDPHRDRQVERRALLAAVGRGQVDGHPLEGEAEAQVADRRIDPLTAFAHRAIRQPDQGVGRQARADVGLDLHQVGIDPQDSPGEYLAQHRLSLLAGRDGGVRRMAAGRKSIYNSKGRFMEQVKILLLRHPSAPSRALNLVHPHLSGRCSGAKAPDRLAISEA